MATQLAKEWAWNFIKIEELNSMKNFEAKEDLLTVVYVNQEEDKHIKNAIDILSEHSKIYSAKNEETIEQFTDDLVADIE
ncbi:hypothetical protein SFC02_04425 [Terribacillus goriensis]|uniref:hypothetical protein n=1 Tax=Terribacillus saccharophilus TaxID=361277 RepID=UPI003982EBD2